MTVAIGPGLPAAASERPEPHGGEPGVGLQASGVGILEDHRQGLGRNGRPNVLQVFPERGGLAAGLLHPAVAAEDFQCRSQAGEDSIRTDYALLRQPGHPLVNPLGQLGQNIAPFANSSFDEPSGVSRGRQTMMN